MGAGAIVTKSVEPHTLVVGAPAKPRRTLDPAEVEGLIHHAEDFWQLAIAHREGQFPTAIS